MMKIFEGRIPADNELNLLSQVLPKDVIDPVVKASLKAKYLPEDWITSSRYASMLSGYGSLLHNVTGHTFGTLLNNTSEGIASVGGSIAKALGYNNPELKTIQSFKDRMQGYGNILADASLYKDTTDAFKNNQVKGSSAATWTKGPQLPGVLTAPERLHSASYEFFGDIEKAANLYEAGMKQARNEGLKGAALVDRARELAANPPKEMADAAIDKANNIRFMGRGDFSKMMSSLTKLPEPDQYMARMMRFGLQNIAPFANIAEQKLLATARYIPGIDKLDPFARAQWKSGIEGKQIVMSRYAIGLSALAAGSQIKDIDKIPLVAEIPVLNLVSAFKKASANYASVLKDGTAQEKNNAADHVFAVMAGASKEMMDETSLKSVGDFFTAMARGGKAGRNYIARESQSLLPYSAASREITQSIDPVKRDISDPTITGTIRNGFKQIIPGLSQTLPVNRISQGIADMQKAGRSPEEIASFIKYSKSQK